MHACNLSLSLFFFLSMSKSQLLIVHIIFFSEKNIIVVCTVFKKYKENRPTTWGNIHHMLNN